jgi:hypothetical protein
MEVICFQDEAYYRLVENVVKRMQKANEVQSKQWLSGEEVMEMLHIKSKTTLQELRDSGKIKFSQPEKKMILYDAASIQEYLMHNIKKTF